MLLLWQNNQPNPADSGVFWTTLYAYTVVWAVFAVLQLLHPSWLCITLVALALNGANVAGYTKCDKVCFSSSLLVSQRPFRSPDAGALCPHTGQDAKKRFAGYGQSVLGSSMGQSVMGSLISRGTSNIFGGLFGGGGSAGAGGGGGGRR